MKTDIIAEGLSHAQVEESRRKHGSNTTFRERRSVLPELLWGMVKEPMFLLLLVACVLYFTLGQVEDGFIMLGALLIVSGISLFQDYRSTSAVRALNKLAAPGAHVIRSGKKQSIPAEEIVVGDLVLLEEGMVIQADGILISSNDLTVNESVLTGESYAISKSTAADSAVFKGTLVTSGGGTMKVEAVGQATRFGRIGTSLQEITAEKTPLQRQIHDFVRKMVFAGIGAFGLVVGFNLYLSGSFNTAFLQGLTLAMSILPEEIPVAFSTFQALGAFRLLKKQVIVKKPQYVETLGAATVICVDKTGTLTQNKMSITRLYDALAKEERIIPGEGPAPDALIEYGMWSSETTPFDPMEKAIHTLYQRTAKVDLRSQFSQVHEYPLGGIPPMMTHIFSDNNERTVIATKGAPEAVLRNSILTAEERDAFLAKGMEYARQGYRVLAVGKASGTINTWPASQEDIRFEFLGFIVFEDPIRPGIPKVLQGFADAGITVKMITGDHAATALAIAAQIGLDTSSPPMTGDQVMQLSAPALQTQARDTDIFVRMFPEAKLKVIQALKAAGEIVAMTGDGVNDAPALKAAHIGVAMGERGSEVAKSAASLILANDDLAGMMEAISLGRKIYDNLKKAIRYIISIHIPIILVVTLPLLLQWKLTDIFSPVHVIFLELIMGPTCSIIYENEPVEAGTMHRPPRKMSFSFLTFRQLLLSMVQGVAITGGCLGLGYYFLKAGAGDETVRTVIFITLLFCNIFLTQLNRSFIFPVTQTIRYRNRLIPLVTTLTLAFIAILQYIPSVRNLFRLQTLSLPMLGLCLGVAALSTCWLEVVKYITRRRLDLK